MTATEHITCFIIESFIIILEYSYFSSTPYIYIYIYTERERERDREREREAAEEQFGIFYYNNKRLYYKTR